MTEPIDWAAAVADIRRRAQQYRDDIEAGDRTATLRFAMQRDADTLAEAIEEAGGPDGSWAALHDQLEEWIRLCSH